MAEHVFRTVHGLIAYGTRTVRRFMCGDAGAMYGFVRSGAGGTGRCMIALSGSRLDRMSRVIRGGSRIVPGGVHVLPGRLGTGGRYHRRAKCENKES